MELNKSYRGSTSSQASIYKIKGHHDENEFSDLIQGNVLSGTKKTDVIDKKGNTYSVKGGAKKWQIFLYGENRFKSDSGFRFSNIDSLFLDSINAFPLSYQNYKSDKNIAKLKLLEHYNNFHNKPETLEEYISVIGKDNKYLNSKISLMKSNLKIINILKDKKVVKKFLSKSIFNNEEVDFWAIKYLESFLVFNKDEAIDLLSEILTVTNSSQTKGRIDDINLYGQKILFR